MDFKLLSANLGLDMSEFIELVELFLSTARQDLQTLSAGYQAGDTETIGESAHSLKGSSGNLGFTGLSAFAKKAEDKGDENDLTGFTEILDAIDQHLGEIESCLNQSS